MVQSGVTKEGLFVEGILKLRPNRWEWASSQGRKGISGGDQQVPRRDQGWQVLGTEMPVSPVGWIPTGGEQRNLERVAGASALRGNGSFWKIVSKWHDLRDTLKRHPWLWCAQQSAAEVDAERCGGRLQLGAQSLVESSGLGEHPVICEVVWYA